MINLEQLKTLPKIIPEHEKQEKLQSYMHSIERSIIDAYRHDKRSVVIDCENDIMSGHDLKRYLKQLGYKVAMTREYDTYLMTKVPKKIEIFFET